MYPSPETSASGIASRFFAADTSAWVTTSGLSAVDRALAEADCPFLLTVPVLGVQGSLPWLAKMTAGTKASAQTRTPATIPSGPTQIFLVPSLYSRLFGKDVSFGISPFAQNSL